MTVILNGSVIWTEDESSYSLYFDCEMPYEEVSKIIKSMILTNNAEAKEIEKNEKTIKMRFKPSKYGYSFVRLLL